MAEYCTVVIVHATDSRAKLAALVLIWPTKPIRKSSPLDKKIKVAGPKKILGT